MNFFKLLHYIVTILLIVLPLTLPVKYITYYIIFLLLIIFHWYFLNGQCILTLSNKKEHKNGFLIDVLDKNNINKIAFDILIYTLLIISFYRINRIQLGSITIIIILLLNKIVYNQLNFKIIDLNNSIK